MVSLFDGISCGRIALDRAGYTVFLYYAYEIDKHAKAISRYHYPDIEQCGDVLDADFSKFADMGIDLVIGGSPCNRWSMAKSVNREIDKTGTGWKLLMRFVEAVRQIKPHFFLLENVAFMPSSIKDGISRELGCTPVLINSALVSAQKRKRLYWTNFKDIIQPEDKDIYLKDILDTGGNKNDIPIALADKSKTILSTLRYENALSMLKRQKMGLLVAHAAGGINTGRTYNVKDKKAFMLSQGGDSLTGICKINLPDGDYTIRKLTPSEAEKCQTLPDGYTARGINAKGKTVKISNTQRYRSIGNGFTVDVIAHILSQMKANNF